MPDLTRKLRVELSLERRRELEAVCRQTSVAAAKVRRARVLLMSDESPPDGRRRDREIAEALGLSDRPAVRLRQPFVRDGESVLEHQPRPPVAGQLDGKAEAHLIALCCSASPDGRDRWTLQLLCDELARPRAVESVCPETVRKRLKKTSSSRGERNASASRRRTGPGLSRGWRKSSTSIRNRSTGNIR
ncbi:MAG: helix-turn-helix domain-containing protein [Nitrospiraceae bacterium]